MIKDYGKPMDDDQAGHHDEETDDCDTIDIDGKTYDRAKGSCDTCDLLDNPDGCFQIPDKSKHMGCYGNECWKVRKTKGESCGH